jgi:hypothetical protein
MASNSQCMLWCDSTFSGQDSDAALVFESLGPVELVVYT